jgi:hypothetical protein
VPPPALAGRYGDEPCRWMLSTGSSVADTSRAAALTVGEAALALARAADGIVIDPYGFPLDHAEALIPPSNVTG